VSGARSPMEDMSVGGQRLNLEEGGVREVNNLGGNVDVLWLRSLRNLEVEIHEDDGVKNLSTSKLILILSIPDGKIVLQPRDSTFQIRRREGRQIWNRNFYMLLFCTLRKM
jgi:hypothetical protein